MPFVSSLREAENEKWLFCLSGDFCQTRPCVAQTGLCPGGAGRSPTWGGNRAHGAFWGRTGALGGFVGRLAVGGFLQCWKERKGRKIPLEGRGRDLRHLPGLFQGCKEAMRTSVLFSLHTICRLFYCPKHKMSNRPLYGTCPLVLFLWAPNRNGGRSRKGRNRSQVFSVTCVTGGKGSSVFCEGGTVSLPQIQDRKAAMCWKLRP